MDTHHDDHDDERLVRASLRAAYPATRSVFSQRRGEQIIRAAALERRHARPSTGGRVAASVAATLTLLVGTIGAAGAALPGQPLYPLKRIVERALIAVTANDNDVARLELRFARRRLAEAFAVGTEEPEATSLAEKFSEHLNTASALGGGEVSSDVAQLQRSRGARRHRTTSNGDEPPAPARRRSPKPQSGTTATTPPSPSSRPSPSSSPSPSPSPSERMSRSPSPTPRHRSRRHAVTLPGDLRRLPPLADEAPRRLGARGDRRGR